MEKMVLRELTFLLRSYNRIPEEQYDFRDGHFTTDQLLYFCQKIRDVHNKKPTIQTVAAFLDLSKASDSVWNNFLVIKLFKVFGIGGKALPRIYDFLRKRFRVKFNNSLSRSFSFFQGVHQGSVISPTLFSLYLAGIASVIKMKCEVGTFAEDIVLWMPDYDLTKLERDINLALEDIRNFALDHKLTFNHTKSVDTVYHPRQMHSSEIVERKKIFWDKELPPAIQEEWKRWGFEFHRLQNCITRHRFLSLLISFNASSLKGRLPVDFEQSS
ncbi:RTase [Trichonephila clavipes]|nr:RTase [Trichonephila clavipes]